MTELLNADVNVNAQDFWDNTAVHYAAMGNDVAALGMLLHKRPNITALNYDRHTTLHCAVWEGHTDSVRTLSKIIDVNVHDQSERTALQVATGQGYVEIVKVLLQKGADIKARDCWDNTALHSATRGGHVAAIEMLLKKGADVNAQNRLGKAALHKAANTDVIKMLLQKGVSINAQDCFMNTALHYACERGHVQAVKMLLESGADATLYNDEGKTAVGLCDRWSNADDIRALFFEHIMQSRGHATT